MKKDNENLYVIKRIGEKGVKISLFGALAFFGLQLFSSILIDNKNRKR